MMTRGSTTLFFLLAVLLASVSASASTTTATSSRSSRSRTRGVRRRSYAPDFVTVGQHNVQQHQQHQMMKLRDPVVAKRSDEGAHPKEDTFTTTSSSSSSSSNTSTQRRRQLKKESQYTFETPGSDIVVLQAKENDVDENDQDDGDEDDEKEDKNAVVVDEEDDGDDEDDKEDKNAVVVEDANEETDGLLEDDEEDDKEDKEDKDQDDPLLVVVNGTMFNSTTMGDALLDMSDTTEDEETFDFGEDPLQDELPQQAAEEEEEEEPLEAMEEEGKDKEEKSKDEETSKDDEDEDEDEEPVIEAVEEAPTDEDDKEDKDDKDDLEDEEDKEDKDDKDDLEDEEDADTTESVAGNATFSSSNTTFVEEASDLGASTPTADDTDDWYPDTANDVNAPQLSSENEVVSLVETTDCLTLAQAYFYMSDWQENESLCMENPNSCSGGCCRLSDHVACDTGNEFTDLPCICNQNTAAV